MIEYAAPIVIGMVVLFVVVLILAVVAERRRRKACRALAEELGLSYAEGAREYVNRYGFLKPIAKSAQGRVSNVLRGQYQGYNVKAFDFQCETASARARTSRPRRTYRYGLLILEHERSFPEVHIVRKGLLSKLGSLVCDREVAVPNTQFVSAFCVRSKHEDFARALCSDELMWFLLAHRDLTLEFGRHCIAMRFRGHLRVRRIAQRLRELVEIRKCLRKELFQASPPGPAAESPGPTRSDSAD